MRFWDASAILPLLVEETTTAAMTALLKDDSAEPIHYSFWRSSLFKTFPAGLTGMASKKMTSRIFL